MQVVRAAHDAFRKWHASINIAQVSQCKQQRHANRAIEGPQLSKISCFSSSSFFPEITAFSLLRALFNFASAFSQSWNLGQFCKFCTLECFAKKRILPVKKRIFLPSNTLPAPGKEARLPKALLNRYGEYEMKRPKFVLFQQTAKTYTSDVLGMAIVFGRKPVLHHVRASQEMLDEEWEAVVSTAGHVKANGRNFWTANLQAVQSSRRVDCCFCLCVRMAKLELSS